MKEDIYKDADSLNHGLVDFEERYFFLNVWPDFLTDEDGFKLFEQIVNDNKEIASENLIFRFGVDTAKHLAKVLSLYIERYESRNERK